MTASMCHHGNCPAASPKGLFCQLSALGSSTTSSLKKQKKVGFTVLVWVALTKTSEWCFLWWGEKKGRLSDTTATCFLRFPNKEAAITMPSCAVLTQRRSREQPRNGRRCLFPRTGINYCAWNRKKALKLWQHWHGLLLTRVSSRAVTGVSKTDDRCERTLIFTEIWDVIQLCEALQRTGGHLDSVK